MSDEKAEATEKPLEKMTVKALREMAKEIPEITGVHGMKKEELIVAINEVRGAKEETAKEETVKEETVKEETVKEETVKEETVKTDKSIKATPVKKAGGARGEIKKQIKTLKAQRQTALEAQDKKMATVYKRRISRLKKKSRKAAA
ncbi:MAG: Rho termination factor N-terminal domain-containing protein [Proteobacteria bacterium]|nr:Rho termination factor N-terminal domain-containing protein [Pseudomonadota bacterium]